MPESRLRVDCDEPLELPEPAGWLRPRRLAYLAVCLVLVGAAAVPLDRECSFRMFHQQQRLPSLLRSAADVYESFGHGVGAAAILLAVALLDPCRRRVLPWLLLMSLGSGVVSNGLKLLVHRIRPRNFNFHHSIESSFCEWLPGLASSIGRHSFPSSHMATAVGLALGLSWFYPRGRWLFVVLAAFVGLNRVITGAHFPSDVFWGAAVGLLVSALCLWRYQRPRPPRQNSWVPRSATRLADRIRRGAALRSRTEAR